MAGKFSWGQRDIAIVMGKDQSNISRLLQRMREDARWEAKLRAFCDERGHKESYRDGIFGLILEFCEEEYLERLIRPRRGRALSEERAGELREVWRRVQRKVEQAL